MGHYWPIFLYKYLYKEKDINMEEFDFEIVAQEIDNIYSSLSVLENELLDDTDDWDDWDDEWSAFGPDNPENPDSMPEDIDEDIIDESIKRIRVVRNGKRIIKFKSTKDGYRVKMVNGRPREVRMKPQETRRRKRGQRRAVKKRKAKRSQINRKRKRSVRKRTSAMNRKRH